MLTSPEHGRKGEAAATKNTLGASKAGPRDEGNEGGGSGSGQIQMAGRERYIAALCMSHVTG